MECKFRPPVLVGEKVIWAGYGHKENQTGVVRWIGNIPELCSGLCVGIELDVSIKEGSGGVWNNRKLFECRRNRGVFVPIKEIKRFSSKTDSRRKLKNVEEILGNESFNSGSVKGKQLKVENASRDANLKSDEDKKLLLWRKQIKNKNPRSKRNSALNKDLETYILQSLTKANVNENLETIQNPDSKAYLNQLTKSMNEIAGYFKEIKEGDERFEKPQQRDGLAPYNSPNLNPTKSKKRFSFLKWFNKKNKDEPNLKFLKDSSATSSPLFSRKENSCESIDTLFSTQTVRSFAYIPPTQYTPSAPPLLYDKSFESVSGDTALAKNSSDKTECIYDRKKKRKAPEPPRFSRENSLPTTLEHKKNVEELDGNKSFHRRTVSESFKDKKAGAYCHVQGKRKAPRPPGSPIYPKLETINSQNSTMNKKKKPAPPPPDLNTNQTPAVSTSQIHDDSQSATQSKGEIEEQERKNNQAPKERLTKDVSLSPLPSRPWYKRSHRESSGNNIIRKDLLKGFDKKKNKEGDDWMPEVGFSRRSLSTESSHSHNKFNIFSKLDKNDDKRKEEKRKSQISILTNISELDREAAEIVRKEQFEEKKMLEANDEKYYTAESDEKMPDLVENVRFKEKKPQKKNLIEQRVNEHETKEENIKQVVKEEKKDEQSKSESSSNVPLEETRGNAEEVKPSSSGLNYFNVENKELNYLNKAWVCQKCTLENPGWRVFCEICKSVKPRFLFKAKQQVDEDNKLNVEENHSVTPGAEETEEKKNQKETSALEELRRKRMDFFTSKADSVTESDLIKSKESTNELSKEEIKEEKNLTVKKEPKELGDQQINDRSSGKSRESSRNVDNKQVTKPEEIAEAYIVTKTIVLEDIIVKKAPKVSAAVQTKPNPTPSSEPGAVRPPRTKKLAFGDVVIANKKKTEITPNEKDLEELTSRLTHAEGLANFRADIETMPPNTEMNTVAVNRLLRKLETAINSGEQDVAAVLAKELALMKINCSVTRQIQPAPSTSKINVDLYIEDKVSHQGPISTEVSPTMTLYQLKQKIQRELGIPLEVQRWILGKKLATDDSKTLEAEGVKSDFCPIFLYLVAPDRNVDKEPKGNIETPTVSEKTENAPNTKTKGWYYNYDEDHYSFCEDSDDDAESDQQQNEDAKEDLRPDAGKTAQDDLKKTELEKPCKSSLLQLEARDNETGAEKELKLISANSVKQKVEQLNKTFAENNRAKVPLRPSQSVDTWKCGTCGFVNSPLKLVCTSCNAKKIFSLSMATKLCNRGDVKEVKKETDNEENIHYKALIELQDSDLVPNAAPFNCPICMVDYATGEGVTLKDCLHTFCRACLINTIKFSEDAEVKCPYLDETYSCTSVLQQREIKALVPHGIFELHLAKSVKEAENKTENAFHCKTPDCKGWCIYEDNVNEFHCPVCKFTNCLTCQAIHTGINCRQYQEKVNDASETDLDAKKSKEMLEEMVEKGEAMACPKCQVVLMKKWGCDWLRCSMCKTEICWVTRGFRWGPGGKGDTSGGCKCGVNGVKCHPKCNYCH